MHACDQEMIDEDLVRLLLVQEQMDPNIQDKFGNTCLSYAAMRGYRYGTRAVQLILQHAHDKLDINKADFKGMTPLMHACRRGHTAVVKLLCRHKKIVRYENRQEETEYAIDINKQDHVC
ncbi:ankyrin repeat domain-containing protein 29 [Reticulomyxa filosa]|uniref:Ankyrin repeat domain-containing protein 29 n=1 Tax=Reticulomyxa filosa TaxID=46433 RepID=X6NT78_RETFI|nr:ankyrin repeat domain-containing protein 29 [Reticulomyxa filosa]|eukprot:ETO28512.1 ankyrin repeat domain-containing protein 29 [Reticulomyxa filosa]